jgi:hypothetical protein
MFWVVNFKFRIEYSPFLNHEDLHKTVYRMETVANNLEILIK